MSLAPTDVPSTTRRHFSANFRTCERDVTNSPRDPPCHLAVGGLGEVYMGRAHPHGEDIRGRPGYLPGLTRRPARGAVGRPGRMLSRSRRSPNSHCTPCCLSTHPGGTLVAASSRTVLAGRGTVGRPNAVG